MGKVAKSEENNIEPGKPIIEYGAVEAEKFYILVKGSCDVHSETFNLRNRQLSAVSL